MNVADNIVKILEEEGIDTVFGIPGEQIMPLYKALSNSSINHVLTRHEQGAAHAADGYTRSSGKIGVCITTASPGALNTVMAVATAYKDNAKPYHTGIIQSVERNRSDVCIKSSHL